MTEVPIQNGVVRLPEVPFLEPDKQAIVKAVTDRPRKPVRRPVSSKPAEPVVVYGSYVAVAKQIAVDNYNEHRNPAMSDLLTTDKMYVISSAKILRNWKVLMGSTLAHGLTWEVTANVGKNEFTLDVYKKLNSVKGAFSNAKEPVSAS